ncbi:MAG: DNA polymerase I [Bilifractor sp.]|jgi:DNA polymerase-1
MKEKLLLIDGHSMLNRAFYGIPLLTNADGVHTNAVYGFLNIMLKVCDEEKPQYLTVAFDVHAPTFRHKKFAEYKGTRKPMPDELREQVPLMKEVLKSMEIPIVEKEGYEADDILGTLSRKGESEGLEVTILSGDRDLLQLATDTIKIRIPRTSKGKTEVFDYYADDVKKEYQVTPEEFIDVKALQGDASDNIPGIPGVGVKTATNIIARYHSIENAHDHLTEIKPKKAMESLRDHYDLAILSKDLATIRLNAPVEFDKERARIGNFYTPEAYEMFKKLDFRNLLGRFDESNRAPAPVPKVQVIRERGQAEKLVKEVSSGEAVGISALISDHSIFALGLCPDRERIFCLIRGGTQDAMTGGDLAGFAKTILSGSSEIRAYDLKEILNCAPVRERSNISDVRIGAYLAEPLRSDYPCDVIASEYAHIMIPSAGEIFGGKKVPSPKDMSEEKAAEYVGLAAFSAFVSAVPIREKLKELQMDRLYMEIEMPLVFTLSCMERAGMKVEKEELAAYGEDLGEQIEKTEQKIYDGAGMQFNINSPKQLGEILFEKMKLPGGKKTKTGYSTAASVLEKLADDVPFVQDVLEYRQLTKLKSTYADALPGYIREDGRIHSNFNQTITATGRISSNEPNLQNIPVRMELGRQIRKVFVPEEGNVYIDADYSQIELRVLASMSGDEKLIDAYRQASDIHRLTASQVFHVPFDEVTPLQRRNAKAVNFGIVYGISSFGLSQGLSISRKEAAEYIDNYFKTYPKIKSFLDGLVESAKEKGYAKTLFQRRRPVPELKDSNYMKRSFGERVAMNSPIQGTAADIIKIAMNRVRRRLEEENYRARLILQVHDELLIEAPREEAEAVSALLEHEMTHAADLAVDLVVDLHTGLSWYDAK